jgi:hypothetical protein
MLVEAGLNIIILRGQSENRRYPLPERDLSGKAAAARDAVAVVRLGVPVTDGSHGIGAGHPSFRDLSDCWSPALGGAQTAISRPPYGTNR